VALDHKALGSREALDEAMHEALMAHQLRAGGVCRVHAHHDR
jgi:hypothetical protein